MGISELGSTSLSPLDIEEILWVVLRQHLMMVRAHDALGDS